MTPQWVEQCWLEERFVDEADFGKIYHRESPFKNKTVAVDESFLQSNNASFNMKILNILIVEVGKGRLYSTFPLSRDDPHILLVSSRVKQDRKFDVASKTKLFTWSDLLEFVQPL